MSAGRRLFSPARPLVGVVAVALLLCLAACTSAGSYADTPLPSATPTTAAAGSTATPVACTSFSAVTSYDPDPDPAKLTAIRQRGRLVVGVASDSLLLGARNPLTGEIEGFDIDVATAVAKAIFGAEGKIQLVVITASDRIPKLKDGSIDMVARAMSMTCDRWNQIAFSAQYYQAGLKLLVPRGSTVTSFAGLSGKKVCAQNGTSTIDTVRAQRGVTAVGAATATACLVLFQQGRVDAIAGDDTVLAGLAAQDPYADVPPIKPLTSEPYGLGVARTPGGIALARFANSVLAGLKADGQWKGFYDHWFASALGAAPTPPVAVYGRT